jgi:hypothetical protein
MGGTTAIVYTQDEFFQNNTVNYQSFQQLSILLVNSERITYAII